MKADSFSTVTGMDPADDSTTTIAGTVTVIMIFAVTATTAATIAATDAEFSANLALQS
ncbi:MAG: hypothetical protein ABJC09_04050 [Terriglobia bacterium]